MPHLAAGGGRSGGSSSNTRNSSGRSDGSDSADGDGPLSVALPAFVRAAGGSNLCGDGGGSNSLADGALGTTGQEEEDDDDLDAGQVLGFGDALQVSRLKDSLAC